MAILPKYYWDSCVWIGLINQEADRIVACNHVISMAEKGEVEIWTSTYTLAEVFRKKCENIQKGIDELGDIEFESFMSNDYVFYAQVDQDVGTLARRLLRSFPILSKPPDAVHLATALWHNLTELHTFDNADLLALDGLVEKKNGERLRICKPPLPEQSSLLDLPELSKQVNGTVSETTVVEEQVSAEETNASLDKKPKQVSEPDDDSKPAGPIR